MRERRCGRPRAWIEADDDSGADRARVLASQLSQPLEDCDADGRVTIGELVGGVNIALGAARTADCPALGDDGRASIVAVVDAVGNALAP
jgi:hypothetical protein